MNEIQIVPFGPQHFPDYCDWFRDALVHSTLGPTPDQEWLDHITEDTSGRQFAVLSDIDLVAVAGFAYSPRDPRPWVLTDFAIKPQLRGRGWASFILDRLIEHLLTTGSGESAPNARPIRAYVDVRNSRGLAFFDRCGWHRISNVPDHDGMIPFDSPS